MKKTSRAALEKAKVVPTSEWGRCDIGGRAKAKQGKEFLTRGRLLTKKNNLSKRGRDVSQSPRPGEPSKRGVRALSLGPAKENPRDKTLERGRDSDGEYHLESPYFTKLGKGGCRGNEGLRFISRVVF